MNVLVCSRAFKGCRNNGGAILAMMPRIGLIVPFLVAASATSLSASEKPSDTSALCKNKDQAAKLAPRNSKMALERYRELSACLEDVRDDRYDRVMAIAREEGKDGRDEMKEIESASSRALARKRVVDAKIARIRRHLDFAGFNTGIGVAGAYHFGDMRVKNASLDSERRVQVLETVELDLRAILLIRRFPWTWKNSDVGLGPFAIVNAGFGQSKVLTSLGAGLMIGVRTKDSGPGLGIGVAYVIDANTLVMRGDFIEGQVAPPEETEVKFVSKTADSMLLVVSYDF